MPNVLSIVTNVLDGLVSKLPAALQPLAKAVIPASVALGAAIIKCLVNGTVNTSSVTIAVTGLVLAVLAYLVPNKKPAAPTKPAA